MKIFMIGGSGFIGHFLLEGLLAKGHTPTLLLRPGEESPTLPGSIGLIRGNPTEHGMWQDVMADHDLIINLAGATIFQRWTDSVKKEILDSRVKTTRRIVEVLRTVTTKRLQLFNASGIGYYGRCGNETLDEEAPAGSSFLSRVAVQWESEARKVEEWGVRVVLCRFGIVLGKSGGALPKIASLVTHHLGGAWGNGDQWFSWIHAADLVNAILFLMDHQDIEGAINFTAPEPLQNREMMSIFCEVLKKKPALRAIPEKLFTLLLGEFSGEFLDGQKVLPRRLLSNGFTFQYPSLKGALSNLLSS